MFQLTYPIPEFFDDTADFDYRAPSFDPELNNDSDEQMRELADYYVHKSRKQMRSLSDKIGGLSTEEKIALGPSELDHPIWAVPVKVCTHTN